MQTVSQQLINIRKRAGLSQADIASILSLTPGAICNYEKGRRPIRANDFEKLKRLFSKSKQERARRR
jgi:transcriptional regulator with XRE-family HTH domain